DRAGKPGDDVGTQVCALRADGAQPAAGRSYRRAQNEGHTSSGAEQLGLGRGELLVTQDTLLMQGSQLIELVEHGRGLRCGGLRRRRWRLLVRGLLVGG